jgi:hypothetical protein
MRCMTLPFHCTLLRSHLLYPQTHTYPFIVLYWYHISFILKHILTLSLYFINITSPLSSNTYLPFHCTLLRSHLLYPQTHTYTFIVLYWDHISFILKHILTLSLYFIDITSPLSSNTYLPFHCTLLISHLLYPQTHTYPFIVLYWDHISFILKHILTLSLYFIGITSPLSSNTYLPFHCTLLRSHLL